MEEKPIGVTLVGTVLLLYVGGYLILLQPGYGWDLKRGKYKPNYRIKGETVIRLYEPLHRIDVWLRPQRWSRR